jgi:hypothetical protein
MSDSICCAALWIAGTLVAIIGIGVIVVRVLDNRLRDSEVLD